MELEKELELELEKVKMQRCDWHSSKARVQTARGVCVYLEGVDESIGRA